MAYQGYIRFPTIHSDRIVFTAEDDLWMVSTRGGRAERLTAGVADATHPHFSPDGRLIAFTGREEGPAEVFVMDLEGNPSRRLTYQGANAQVAAWQADGSGIIYSSAAGQPMRRGMERLYQVPPRGGVPTMLPYGVAHSIAFGPNGAVVVGRHTQEPARWKRYRGGTAGYLWIDPDGSGEFHRLLDLHSNISYPCWVGERIYFISDHEGIGNVYSVLPSGEDIRRHTRQEDYYARGLATDGAQLVYHAGGDLFVLEPDSTEGQRLEVELPGNRAQRARKFVSAPKYMDSWGLNPEGNSVAITSRGKAFSFGNWEGAVIQHGEPDGIRYRLATWLADGRHLVTVADAGDEPRLVVFDSIGVEEPRILDQVDVGHVTELRPAPRGDALLLANHRNEVVHVDLAQGTSRVLDRSDYRRAVGIAWSPDARWAAYGLYVNPRQSVIKLANLESGDVHQVTEPVLRDTRPAFDPAGRYLYFIGGRDFDPVMDYLQFDFGFPRGHRPYLITLRRDLRSPFTPEPEAPKSEAAEQAEAAKTEEKKVEPERVEIDLDGISSRVVAFPVPEGRYARVQGTEKGAVFSSYPVEGTRQDGFFDIEPEAKGSLEFYNFETHRSDRLVEGITDFEVTPNGKTLIYRAGNRLRVLRAGEKPREDLPEEQRDKPGRESGWIDLDRVKVSVRPEAEWRQMYNEIWRLQREHFWVPDMGGVDWASVREKYRPLVDRVASRGEFSDLIWEMQGELGSSHAYEFGGEYREHPEYPQGYLGVDWELDHDTGEYRIGRIVRGDPWSSEWSSPLLAPGANVAEGDVVLAINGQRLSPERGPWHLLVNQAGNEVQLLVRPASGGEPRTVTVKALGDEFRTRYRDWVESNRRTVHEATDDKVGYLHIPDMGPEGFAEFHRYYLAEYDHDALIVDLRGNGGGFVSGLLLHKLSRPRLGYAFQRWGAPEPYFEESPRGPLVAVTDENAGSDGDIFSHGFKMLNLGPLIGKRTWGGVIGISNLMPLADTTITTQPEYSFWFKDVGWGVENYGTDPTIEVDYAPQDYAAGRDPQLERAIAEAKRLMQERPSPTPEPGPRPDRSFPVKTR